MLFYYAGHMWLYFNRHKDAPRVWCVAPMDRKWEVTVTNITCQVPITTKYLGPSADHEVTPSAVFECHGQLCLHADGSALIISS
jgi:hypothetical protein